jgi:hypothetical protein
MPWFSVRTALVGSPCLAIQTAVPDIQEELETRKYLRNPRVSCDPEAGRAIVEVEDEALTLQHASGGVYDDIFESTCAVLRDHGFIRVEILEVMDPPHD